MNNIIRIVRIPNKFAAAVVLKVPTSNGPGYCGFCLGFPGDKQEALTYVKSVVLSD